MEKVNISSCCVRLALSAASSGSTYETRTHRSHRNPIPSSNQPSMSSSNIDDDSLTEILTRLPLKSLFRFKCVCKTWHRLISGAVLLRRPPLVTSAIFCHFSGDKPMMHACTSAGDLRVSDLPFGRNSESILDYSNGLLLCHRSSDEHGRRLLASPLIVVDPITRSWAHIPRPAKESHLWILAFDPAHSPHFKVVRFTRWLSWGAEVEVFGSDTGAWAAREVRWGLSPDAVSTTMCYFDGVLYALAFPNYLVGVDLAGEGECRKLELPPRAGPGGRIGKLAGRICYACRGGDRVNIWALGDDEGSEDGAAAWALRHVIGFQAVASATGCGAMRAKQFKLVAFDPTREVAFFWVPGKMVGYDLRRNEAESTYELEEELEGAIPVHVSVFPFSGDASERLKNFQSKEKPKFSS